MKTALLFPPLMKLKKNSFIEFFEEFQAVRDKFEEASDILKLDLAANFFSDDEELINKGIIARTSIVTICSAIYDLIKDKYQDSSYFLGPSLGLINAVHCSGGMSFSDSLNMVKAMCEIESQNPENRKYGVYFFYNIDTKILLECIDEYKKKGYILEPCMYASPNQMIVNGDFKSLELLSTKIAKYGGLGVIIPYSPHSHCNLLTDVQKKFKESFMTSFKLSTPYKPIISNVFAREISTPEEIKEDLILQYTSPVLWYQSLKYIHNQGVEKLIVLGPGNFIRKSLNFTDIPFYIDNVLSTEDVREKLTLV